MKSCTRQVSVIQSVATPAGVRPEWQRRREHHSDTSSSCQALVSDWLPARVSLGEPKHFHGGRATRRKMKQEPYPLASEDMVGRDFKILAPTKARRAACAKKARGRLLCVFLTPGGSILETARSKERVAVAGGDTQADRRAH